MQRKGPGKDLGDWPLTVLVDQCLVENGQPVPDEAMAELTRWTSGEALDDF